jgi:hypothetical protein
MKRSVYLLAALLMIIAGTAGCGTQKAAYKTYEIDDVKYLPVFSSSTPDYFLKNNNGALFMVGDTTFSTDISKASGPAVMDVAYTDVSYVEEELDGAIDVFGDELRLLDLSAFRETAGYKVMAAGQDTGYRVYYLDDEVWIGHFSWFGEKKDAWWADYVFSVKAV